MIQGLDKSITYLHLYIIFYYILTDVRSPEINRDSGLMGNSDNMKGEDDKPNRLMSLEKQLNIENKVK
jgi:hypothetical protein